ncbi:hypothetical protein CEXT_496071 [Caerostris extrusa]|uniref:Uncharacterized protein n=1 Tax=Caerostris extrusa TaxID=172846 RepID=A0AAV4SFR7_CAEEX|nr:hypothetical protein CEXT_496071 [Caerostris extrusa]
MAKITVLDKDSSLAVQYLKEAEVLAIPRVLTVGACPLETGQDCLAAYLFRFDIISCPNCMLCGQMLLWMHHILKMPLLCLDIYVTDTGRQERTSRSLVRRTCVAF